MSDAIFIFGLAGFLIFCIVYDIYQKAGFEKKEFKRLLANFPGKQSHLSVERIEHLDGYLSKHFPDKCIDTITWNDLGMDSIYEDMLYTHSSAGEEYLYYQLHRNDLTIEELDQFEKLVSGFSDQPEVRAQMEVLFEELGHTDKYSLYEYLDTLQELGKRSSYKDLLVDFIILAGIGLIPFYTTAGILLCVCGAIYNVISYFSVKKQIEPYIISFIYVLRLLRSAQRISETNADFLTESVSNLKTVMSGVKKIRFGNSIALSVGRISTTGNPLEILWDYIKMAFHIDLLFFNRLYHLVDANKEPIDRLFGILGELETAIAVCTYRESHKEVVCVPELSTDFKGIRITDGVHPMMTDAVPNSIQTEKGILITGSNASGKSTFLKMVALNALLAQTIHTAFAGTYQAPVFRLFSSMSLKDSLDDHDSYFMVEIKSIRRVIVEKQEESRPILCFVDEILRGTNTVERIAASSQILKALSNEGILCFAATHDGELTELLAKLYTNYHFKEEMSEDDIHFSYRLLDGPADTRNAISLLKISGFDEEIIRGAKQMVASFEESGSWSMA